MADLSFGHVFAFLEKKGLYQSIFNHNCILQNVLLLLWLALFE